MEDRVADVLAQRAALGTGRAAGIAGSILLHGALVAAAVWSATQRKDVEPVNVINIRLAPVAAVTPPRSAAPQRVPAPVVPKIVEPAPVVEKTTPKVEPKTVPMSPFGQSTKKGSETPAPAPPAPAAKTAGSVGAADVPVGGAGVTGLEGGDFPHTLYINRMKDLIGARWFRPQVTPGITTTVYFVIQRDGTISEAKTIQPSGNGTFDRAALRAVLESSPLPPLPFAYNGTYLGVHLTFK